MDISMDIHEKSVDMDMDMDVIFHIHGNPGYSPQTQNYKKNHNEIAQYFRSCNIFKHNEFMTGHYQ